MKLLLSSEGFFPHACGGGQVYVEQLAQELTARGHRVVILTTAPWENGNSDVLTWNYMYEGLNVTAVSVNPRCVTTAGQATKLSAPFLEALRGVVSRECPDVAHINGCKAALVSVCRKMGVPHVVTIHHTGIACPNGALLRPDLAVCSYRARGDVCVSCCCKTKTSGSTAVTLLGTLPRWMYVPAGALINRLRKPPYVLRGLMFPWVVEQILNAQDLLLRSNSLFIAPSRFMRELVVKNGTNPANVVVEPHGIVPIKECPRLTFKTRPVRFGYIGRINRPKGLHILTQALARTAASGPCELHIAGDAKRDWERAYREECLTGIPPHVRVTDRGYVARDRLHEVVDDMDVVVVPSLVPESFGLVVAEAHSAGRPVIVSDSGALPELVRHGVDGIVVPRNDVPALARALQALIENPKDIIRLASAIRPVRTVQQYADTMERIYARVANVHPAEPAARVGSLVPVPQERNPI